MFYLRLLKILNLYVNEYVYKRGTTKDKIQPNLEPELYPNLEPELYPNLEPEPSQNLEPEQYPNLVPKPYLNLEPEPYPNLEPAPQHLCDGLICERQTVTALLATCSFPAPLPKQYEPNFADFQFFHFEDLCFKKYFISLLQRWSIDSLEQNLVLPCYI